MTHTSQFAQIPLHIVVVGGSLAGSLAALALARSGHHVTVLERSHDLERIGAALGGVDVGGVEQVTGVHLTGSAPARGHLPLSWTDVHRQLQSAVQAHPDIDWHPHTTVAAVGQNTAVAWARVTDDTTYEGDVLVGADGLRSIVRIGVDPAHDHATFAGYLIWLGVVDEADLPPGIKWPRDVDILSTGDRYLLGYPLPALDGSFRSGDRRLGWAVYDASYTSLLHVTGAVTTDIVNHSLSGTAVPDTVYTELAKTADDWPRPWSDAIRASMAHRQLTGTPIAEYLPNMLTNGRMVLVGDAAHLPTPMTGNGFDASLTDAAMLRDVLNGSSPDQVQGALEAFDAARLPAVRRLVAGGQQFSRGFARR